MKNNIIISGSAHCTILAVTVLAEKNCTLAEELGHHYTTSGDIINLSTPANRKQEQKARIWAYRQLLDLNKLIDCFKHDCTSVNKAAEYLEVTEAFFLEAICYYKQHYGIQTVVGKYIICLERFRILELYPKQTISENKIT